MLGQRIKPKYLDQLKEFFINNSLEDFQSIYSNEKIFTDWLNVKTFKFTNSGTSALYLILKHIKQIEGLGTELKVVGPAFSHISWINCCKWLDVQHDFLDVRQETLSLDPQKLQDMIDNNNIPNVVVMIDMGGYIGEDTLKVKEICDFNNIILIEDSAHAFGQSYKGYKAGTIGDYSFFSFSNPKLLTSGEGGAIVSPHHDLNSKFEELIYQGGWYKYNKETYTFGLNFIMSNWMTELLKYQLQDIEEIQKEWFNRFNSLNNKDQIIIHESDNKFYAPSFFAYFFNKVPKIIKENKLDNVMFQRYKNMGNESHINSQYLEDHLVYWKI